ncbi:hypothetical protein [Nesterenkonia pannonica]|uniref:hypothetical protein n=1 Tax=Nesterenkonia pannonica TaxID=1548602 RepID=UPI002164C776|nr:hypothetical protein [Nesterenkonia pannonica]
MLSALTGAEVPDRDYLVLGHGAHTFQRSVRTRDRMYVCTYHPGSYGVAWEALYNMVDDPTCSTI